MIITANRQHVELLGKLGTWSMEKDEYVVCRTMAAYYLCVDKHDIGYTKHAIEDGFWESWITHWMLNNVKPGSLVADIGANYGYYSFLLAENWCEVHAYEPQLHLVKLLAESKKINKTNVQIFHAAVSDVAGESTLYIPKNNTGIAALSLSDIPKNTEHDEEVVKTVCLDDCPHKYNFIKIDAEGAERQIWRGMQKYMEYNPECVYLIEWCYRRYEDPEVFAHELFEKCNVTCIDELGNEQPIEAQQLLVDSDWLTIVIRKK